MVELTVQHEGLDHLGREMSRGSRQIAGILDDLNASVATLRGAWSGAASDAYDRAQHDWTAALTEINILLESLAGRVVDSQRNYADTQRHVERMWTS